MYQTIKAPAALAVWVTAVMVPARAQSRAALVVRFIGEAGIAAQSPDHPLRCFAAFPDCRHHDILIAGPGSTFSISSKAVCSGEPVVVDVAVPGPKREWRDHPETPSGSWDVSVIGSTSLSPAVALRSADPELESDVDAIEYSSQDVMDDGTASESAGPHGTVANCYPQTDLSCFRFPERARRSHPRRSPQVRILC